MTKTFSSQTPAGHAGQAMRAIKAKPVDGENQNTRKKNATEDCKAQSAE
jgi:hypothetical protein